MMAVSPFDSVLHGGLLSDAETAALFGDAAEIAAMIEVEAALARAEGAAGVIPAAAAAALDKGLAMARVEPAALTDGTAAAGVSVPALVAALRAQLPDEAANHLHWGATSQDIVDSGLVLRLRGALHIPEGRPDAVIATLTGLADAHRLLPMVARTRGQQATLTSFGLKCAVWLDPLLRQRERLHQLRPRLLAVQFGGAAGTLSVLGDAGPAVLDGLARELDLAPAAPWHATRDRLSELAGWLATTTGALGKLGGDLVLLSQSEVGEVRLAATGGSSTMPQKQNPVGPEALVALARFNAGQVAALQQAALHDLERDAAAWTLEWLTLPQMTVATAAALRHGCGILAGVTPDGDRMDANITAAKGLIFAEAASFALTAHMPRAEAQARVKAAAQKARDSGRALADCLAEETGAAVDWPAVMAPQVQLGAATAIIDNILKRARAGKA